MNIKTITIESIRPYKRNAKKHSEKQVDNVAESIKQFGMVQPIVLDYNNEIIIGHCRFEACKKLGMQSVPCVCAEDLTDEQVKKLRIIDNKVNESPWDFSLLDEEIEGLDFEGFDIGLNSLDDIDIDEFFEEAEDAPPKEPKTIKCPHCGEIIEV